MIKGIVRKLDELGRITLPKENRMVFGMVAKEPVDMWLDSEVIKVQLFDEIAPKGIKRCIDDLGRITLPKEFRRSLKINDRDLLDMYLDGQAICIKPLKLQCVHCGNDNEDKLVELDGVYTCPCCVRKLWEKVMGGTKK